MKETSTRVNKRERQGKKKRRKCRKQKKEKRKTDKKKVAIREEMHV